MAARNIMGSAPIKSRCLHSLMLFYSLLTILATQHAYAQIYQQPEQIHLAFGNRPNDIVVTWATYNITNQSMVHYGNFPSNLEITANGTTRKLIDHGPLKSTQYIHKVILENLKFNSKYFYHCGSSLGWSSIFWFETPPDNGEWQPHIAVYGDLGNTNARSLPYLQEASQMGIYDAIFHLGDFAYNLETNNGLYGDAFLKQIEPIAAYVPYMTCPGNHETANNFSHYKARFNMPGNSDSQWYSIVMGPVRMIVITTEIFEKTSIAIATNQYNWLKKELENANLPINRAKQPWIIVAGHRPIYCSDPFEIQCMETESAESDIIVSNLRKLERLYYMYGVDVGLWAHVHAYERFWPIYENIIYNGSIKEPYTNAGAPIHIVTGSAGAKTHTESFMNETNHLSAFRSLEYGYTALKVHNKTHLQIQQISVDRNGQIIDSIFVIKDSHSAYMNSGHIYAM